MGCIVSLQWSNKVTVTLRFLNLSTKSIIYKRLDLNIIGTVYLKKKNFSFLLISILQSVVIKCEDFSNAYFYRGDNY